MVMHACRPTTWETCPHALALSSLPSNSCIPAALRHD